MNQLTRWNIGMARKREVIESREDSAAGEKSSRKKVIIVANKMDVPGAEEGFRKLWEMYEDAYPVIAVSLEKKNVLEALKRTIFEVSGIIRVYTKEPGKDPDLGEPFTVPSGTTVLELSEMIHKDFVRNLKYACIWGSSRFPGQRVQKDHVLQDKDVVEFHL